MGWTNSGPKDLRSIHPRPKGLKTLPPSFQSAAELNMRCMWIWCEVNCSPSTVRETNFLDLDDRHRHVYKEVVYARHQIYRCSLLNSVILLLASLLRSRVIACPFPTDVSTCTTLQLKMYAASANPATLALGWRQHVDIHFTANASKAGCQCRARTAALSCAIDVWLWTCH